VDVFRRARRFEQSITLANKLLESQRLSKVIDQVLRFELVLASSADGAAHRVEEAVDDSKLID